MTNEPLLCGLFIHRRDLIKLPQPTASMDSQRLEPDLDMTARVVLAAVGKSGTSVRDLRLTLTTQILQIPQVQQAPQV